MTLKKQAMMMMMMMIATMIMMMMTIIGLSDLASGKACGRYTGCTLCLLSGSGLNNILEPRHHHLHIPTIHHHGIFPPGGNMTGGHVLASHDDEND